MKLVFRSISILVCLTVLVAADYAQVKAPAISPQQANKRHRSAQSLIATPSYLTVAKWLNWVPTPAAHCPCEGYYKIPKDLLLHPNPGPLSTQRTVIQSQGPATLRADGVSVLRDRVVATQPGRIVKADVAKISYDRSRSNIKRIQLVGHVRIAQGRSLVVGRSGSLNMQRNVYTVKGGWYRFSHRTLGDVYHLWGRARSYLHMKNGDIKVKQGSISSCNPQHPTWQLFANNLYIHDKQQYVSGHDAVLKVKGIPVFYSPYFSFPTSTSRRSGWLMPQVGYRTQVGYDLGLPYYWNIAPNYDATLTPLWYSKRGFRLQGQFRYLTQSSSGDLQFSGLPDDNGFAQYRSQLLQQGLDTGAQPAYLSRLRHASDTRGAFSFTDYSDFTSRLHLGVNLNAVSDSYYLNDFSAQLNSIQTNQLLNRIALSYDADNWSLEGLLQAYQTLHQLNQSYAADQYKRLPELDFNADYPGWLWGSDFAVDAQFVNFSYASDFAPDQTFTRSEGLRWHLRPRLSHVFDLGGIDITPTVMADAAAYVSHLPAATATASRPAFNQARAIPIITLSGQANLQRTLHWGHHDYWQTLIPQIQYEYVPFLAQSGYPNFDSERIPFSYSQLFSLNQFSGFDRLQNTSQISLGVQSQILRQEDGAPLLSMGLGTIDYLALRRVCLTTGCLPQATGLSPIAGQLSFYPGAGWTTTASLSWDLQQGLTEAGVNSTYDFSGSQVLNFGYEFVKGSNNQSTSLYGLTEDTNLLSFGAAWPLSSSVSTLGYLFYNINQKRPEKYFFGIQYDTCCWALRAIYQRYYIDQDLTTSSGQFGNAVYLQLLFKGLGGVSSSDPTTLLATAVPGYVDPFKIN